LSWRSCSHAFVLAESPTADRKPAIPAVQAVYGISTGWVLDSSATRDYFFTLFIDPN
jgi:hypothetical protein